MKKKTVFLCVVLLFFGVTAVAGAAPTYYTYQGSLFRITTGGGGTPEIITNQGISLGDEFIFIFAIDYSRPGQYTRNNGEVTIIPGRVYADLIYSSKHFEPLNPEYDTESGIAEYNHLVITEYTEGWRSDGYTGPGGALAHIEHDGFYPTPIYEWEIGQEFRVTFAVVDFLIGGSAAGYTRGTLIDISDTNPLVSLDIKPGIDPNSFNCNNENGVIDVAILTTDVFDATTVDHTKVTFQGASETHEDKKSGLPKRHEEDVDEDGDIDLVFHFRIGDTNLTCESTEGTLIGETFDGTPIQGTDSITSEEPYACYDGVPKTGQTTIYYAGDDGDLKMGVPWPVPRFTDNGDTVTDNMTDLMWTKNAQQIAGTMNWYDAVDACSDLNYADNDDWRLPNVRELLSMIDYGQDMPALTVGHPFDNTMPSDHYWWVWSSTDQAYRPGNYALVVSLGHGDSGGFGRGVPHSVWCVRGGN